METIEEIKGMGIKAIDHENNNYIIGSNKIISNIQEKEHSLYLLKNNKLLGWIDVKDEVRKEAEQVINYYRSPM